VGPITWGFPKPFHLQQQNAMTLSLSAKRWFLFALACSLPLAESAASGAGTFRRRTNPAPIRPIKAPFEMPQLQRPIWPEKTFEIPSYGAKPDAEQKNTEAIRRAITACAEAGGGTVRVPEGRWLTGPVHLKSGVRLEIEKGGELIFADDIPDYLPAVETSRDGFDCYNYSPLIYAVDCTNVAVTGRGKVTCKRDRWKEWDERTQSQLDAMASLYYMAADGVPVEKRQMANDQARLRPQLIQFLRCTNVLVEGLTIRNSPFWTIHPVKSERIIIRELDVQCRGHNTDGVDPDQSRFVLLEDCVFDQDDDAIVIKAGRNQDGWRGRPSENIVIRNCTIKRGHTLLAIGTEVSGGVRNVYLHDCRNSGDTVSQALLIKTNHRRGGFIENITMKNTTCDEVSRGLIEIQTDVFYVWKTLVETRERRLTRIQGIHVENVHAQKAKNGLIIKGEKELPVRDVTLKNISVKELTDAARVVSNVEGVREEHVAFGKSAHGD
jgi:polygalacturonase